MHWVDMEWLWGYHVLPGCIDDMLRFCRETGAKGNVNFDGVGYEKLVAESPEAFARLKEAVRQGIVEPVGCSYGQPYGLFHGGESNVRQRIYGVRTVLRLLGVRPRAFWEEEFDFFPQLPQMLAGCGFLYGSLFFQWTWHTPEVPKESAPAVYWESPDGSRLAAATRNDLNLHQWPEDMQILFDQFEAAAGEEAGPPRLILQWLELMPSPDWMCRSEVLLPKMKQLLSDSRLDIRFATLAEYLSVACQTDLPIRRYRMDEAWHGMTLGKNGDRMRRASQKAEASLLTAEAASATLGLFGRPYPRWDVYPVWELEEGWRELLQAQHHDNDECEGLCGHVGMFSYERSLSLSRHAGEDALKMIARRTRGKAGDFVLFNPLGWPRTGVITADGQTFATPPVPAFGCRVVSREELSSAESKWSLDTGVATCECAGARIRVDSAGRIIEFSLNRSVLFQNASFCFIYSKDSERRAFQFQRMAAEGAVLKLHYVDAHGGRIEADLSVDPSGCLDVRLAGRHLVRPDGGINAAYSTLFPIRASRIRADQPYGISEIHPSGTRPKKYPTGDWMTSPQWFEQVENPFHSASLVDLTEGTHGLLILHDGSQQWFQEENGFRNVLNAYDPWDEDYWIDRFDVRYRLIGHDALSAAQRARLAQEFLRPLMARKKEEDGGDIREGFAPVRFEAEGVLLAAFYRETEEAGTHLARYAGVGIGYPYVLRMVEYNGEATTVTLDFGAEAAKAFKTNLMGEIESELPCANARVQLNLRPHEIATLYLDFVPGRKQPRDLDAARNVWATVHRTK